MQRHLSRLRQSLSRLIFPAALLACASATAGDITSHATPTDDSLMAVGQNYAILCNVCSTSNDFINKAKTLYPRARASLANVYNLQTGVVRSVVLDWDPEVRAQLGGYETSVDPAITEYVFQASSAYRKNGNSLSFTLVVRADGSVYFSPLAAAAVELKPAGLSPLAPLQQAFAPKADMTLTNKATPAPGSPIDLRGYNFPSNFNQIYPAYPSSSYDLAFGNPARVDDFLRDQISGLGGGGMSGFFRPQSTPVPDVPGGTELLQQTQGVITVVVPLPDGGWARVTYDRSTGDVIMKEIRDGQGNPLPPGNGQHSYLINNPLGIPNGISGSGTWSYFREWADANGINIESMGGGNNGYIVRCVSPTANEITCTLFPR